MLNNKNINKDIKTTDTDISSFFSPIVYKNNFHLDWLTLVFKNIDNLNIHDILDIFVNSVNKDNFVKENFFYQDKGVVSFYQCSYNFLGNNCISFNENLSRSDMGICVQFTGTAFRMLSLEDIKKFVSGFVEFYNIDKAELFNYLKCSRLDIAYDDFNNHIPYQEIVEAVDIETTFTGELANVCTTVSRIQRSDFTIYKNNYNGISSNNVTIGNRGAVTVRLYDKKIEQKTDAVSSWKRLEIEFRTKGNSFNANEAFVKLLNDVNLAHIFVDRLQKTVMFYEPKKCYNSCDLVKVSNIASWWLLFINSIITSHNMYYLSCKETEQVFDYDLYKTAVPSVETLFTRSLRSFVKSYGLLISCIDNLNPGILNDIRQFYKDKLFEIQSNTTKKYLRILDYFKDYTNNELCEVLYA